MKPTKEQIERIRVLANGTGPSRRSFDPEDVLYLLEEIDALRTELKESNDTEAFLEDIEEGSAEWEDRALKAEKECDQLRADLEHQKYELKISERDLEHYKGNTINLIIERDALQVELDASAVGFEQWKNQCIDEWTKVKQIQKERDQFEIENKDLKDSLTVLTRNVGLLSNENYDIWDALTQADLERKLAHAERDQLKAENESRYKRLIELEITLGKTCKAWSDEEKENKKLRERVEKLREFLTMKSKRSSYQWTVGGTYYSGDCKNEGQLKCAMEALTQDDELEKQK